MNTLQLIAFIVAIIFVFFTALGLRKGRVVVLPIWAAFRMPTLHKYEQEAKRVFRNAMIWNICVIVILITFALGLW